MAQNDRHDAKHLHNRCRHFLENNKNFERNILTASSAYEINLWVKTCFDTADDILTSARQVGLKTGILKRSLSGEHYMQLTTGQLDFNIAGKLKTTTASGLKRTFDFNKDCRTPVAAVKGALEESYPELAPAAQ